MTEFSEIPVIDLESSTGPEQIMRQFRDAYGTTGFGYVIGHGIDPNLIDAVFDASARFHALPLADKMAVAVNDAHRGYIPIDTSTDVTSTLAEVTRPNQSASFMMMREDNRADPEIYLSGPNLWPDLDGFRETLESYCAAMSTLAVRIMKIALQASDVSDFSIMSAFDDATTWLRLLHYPPRPVSSPGDLYGSAPHTDFGCLTLLAQDDVGGLQVQTRGGAWVDVPCLPGSFVVNVGDMLHRMSNGRLLSTPHRVINTSGRERLSCPFFFDPHVNTRIAPLPGTGTPCFEPIIFGEFLRAQLEASYQVHFPKTGTGFPP